MSDPNLICTLIALNERTGAAFRRNEQRYLAPLGHNSFDYSSRETTPSLHHADLDDSASRSRLRLTFNQKPKDIRSGFVFGSNARVCDAIIGSQKDGVSGRHFSIYFDDTRRLLLEDTSSNGTVVSYNGQGTKQKRTKFTWILFERGIKKEVIIQDDITFKVEVANHDDCQSEYEGAIDQFRADMRTAMPPMCNLNVESQDTTAGPTRPLSPKHRPIYFQEKMLSRKGEFGIVHRAFDVSTGIVYAAKEFLRGDPRREVENLRDNAHVCIR